MQRYYFRLLSSFADNLKFSLAWSLLMTSLDSVCTWRTNSVAPEPEGSSPHSQEPANDPYPEPGESTPHPPNQSP
jgi:hypothetical protein